MRKAVDVSLLLSMADALSGINWEQVAQDFRDGKPEVMLGDVLLIAQEGTSLAGYVVPEAAMASKYIALFRQVYPGIVLTAKLADEVLPPPEKLKPGEISAWGHNFTAG